MSPPLFEPAPQGAAPESAARHSATAESEAAWRLILALREGARGQVEPPRRLALAGAVVELGPGGAWSSAGRLAPAAAAILDLYLPYALAPAARGLVVAHLGQSLDGRIATPSGSSRWITGEEDILHTHRMRALADAVIVGAGTVACDDPRLTVRHCEGKSPVRVVIDPACRLAGKHSVFDGAAPTLVLTGDDVLRPAGGPERIALPRDGGRFRAGAIRDALARRGLRHLFIEGGGVTVSHFLAEGVLDRLQVTVAPLIIGSGRPVLSLAEISHPAEGLRPATRRFALGADFMLECVLA